MYMKEGRIIQPDQIHLIRLQTLKGTLNSEAYGGSGPGNEYDYKFDVSIGVNARENIVGVKLTAEVKAITPAKEISDPVAAYTHELIFVIDNLADFSDPLEGQSEPKVERIMLATLVGIAYSTVRGIIYTRTQGPDFKGILLPVIDPKKLLKPDEKLPTTDHTNA